jgi:hypothetical protein
MQLSDIPMKRLISLLAINAIILGLWRQGDFLQQLLTTLAGFFLVIPVGLILTLITLWSYRKQVQHDWLPSAWIRFGVCLAALLLSYGLGTGIHHLQQQQTRDYVAKATQLLEAEKQRTGHYPTTLPESTLGSPPKWLRETHTITLEPDFYRFSYLDPSQLLGSYTFDSQNHRWEYED